MRLLLLTLLVGALVFVAHAEDDMDDTGVQDVDHEAEPEPEDHDDDMETEDHDDHHGGMRAGEKSHHTWSYNLDDGKTGPAMWNELFQGECGEKMQRQSPINIKVDDAKFDEHLDDISFIQPPLDDTEKRMYLFNNGHSAKIEIENAELYMIGGNLGSEFKVAQLHFHWGSTDEKGSEHQLNDKQFPLELHVVTYDAERFLSLGDAVTGDNSLAVFGTLFRVTDKDNPNFDRIIERLNDIALPGKDHMVQIPWFSIRSLMPPTTNKYFRYEGSLTTPTCDQSVVWTVFAIPNYISKSQLAEFRKLVEGTNDRGETVQLEDNWRAPQPLHGRQVTMSFVPEDEYEKIKDKRKEHKQAASTDNLASVMSISVPVTLLSLFISKFIKH